MCVGVFFLLLSIFDQSVKFLFLPGSFRFLPWVKLYGKGLGHSSLGLYPQGLFYFYPWVLSSEPVFGYSESILRLWDASEPFYGDSLVFGFVPNLVFISFVFVLYRLVFGYFTSTVK